MTIKVYQPHLILAPANCLRDTGFTPAEDAGLGGLMQLIDRTTLCNDVFLSKDNETLILLTPILRNFCQKFFPVKVQFNGSTFEQQSIIHGFNVSMVFCKIERALVQDSNEVQLNFNQQYTVNLLINRNDHVQSDYGKHTRHLVTNLKDGDLLKIKSWIDHYVALGIKSIFIYDNNSQDKDRLERYLQPFYGADAGDSADSQESQVILTIVKYIYNNQFGYLPTSNDRLRFCNEYVPISSKNHCALYFVPNGVQLFSFDVDEFLIPCNKANYFEHIDKLMQEHAAAGLRTQDGKPYKYGLINQDKQLMLTHQAFHNYNQCMPAKYLDCCYLDHRQVEYNTKWREELYAFAASFNVIGTNEPG